MMKKNKFPSVLSIILISLLTSCASVVPEKDELPVEQTKEFNSYWYTGKAEINVYELEQARYGEIHQGKAVRIFVTEDFLLDKQVKKETMTSEKSCSILKMNFIKKFPTGIYDYSMMTSVFTPANNSKYKQTIKASMSSQEWCGHAYSQLNLKNGQYDFSGHSYFENEADTEYYMDYAFLEDEIWTQIRLNPMGLPQGDLKMIPSLMHSRLLHYEVVPLDVKAGLALQVDDDGNELYVYNVRYVSGRTLEIHAHSVFPFRIVYWQDSYDSGFGPKKTRLTTKGTLSKSVKEPYWGQNSNADEYMRKELGL